MYYGPMFLFMVKAIIIVTDKKVRINFKHNVHNVISQNQKIRVSSSYLSWW